MNAKDILDELKAEEELLQRGWTKEPCPKCAHEKRFDSLWVSQDCYLCDGRGWNWKAPITK